jgi:hypothetical protein
MRRERGRYRLRWTFAQVARGLLTAPLGIAPPRLVQVVLHRRAPALALLLVGSELRQVVKRLTRWRTEVAARGPVPELIDVTGPQSSWSNVVAAPVCSSNRPDAGLL